ncbi:hypothetical protein [Virgibacillus sp. DJP39]|uniref:hypothetical protein n=1 Tax=Virgibacillus sp. DJP39 TaxID=3409790 RepID=UPI003BB695D1
MRKMSLLILTIILLSAFTNEVSVSAYSYGDPNKEKIAEVYRKMVIKLNESPPNYEAAKEFFLTVKEEIDMHMGKDASEIVLDPLNNKDKKATINNMEKLLALNISRRLEALEQGFGEYDTSKKLLAKAFATYEALSPTVRDFDPDLDEQIKQNFDSALEALGNPGLFGVGEKKSNFKQFKKSKQFILDSLKEPFEIEAYDVGHFTKGDTEQELKNQDTQSSDYTDYSELKNWIPILIIALIICAASIYFIRKRK